MCRAAPAGPVEIGELCRRFGDEVGPLDRQGKKIVRDLGACRTAALGGHRYRCNRCGHEDAAYNSCCNRHCPKCQSLQQARWLDARMADLLPIPYFHAVFTIPNELHPIFRHNRAAAYRFLFAAVAETLREVALNPKRLDAQIGFIAILHTWTQRLHYHPHVHAIVTGGGLSPDRTKWRHSKQSFLLPVGVLRLVFRGKLLGKIERGLKNGHLEPPGEDEPRRHLQAAARKHWQIYLKPPMAGPEQVLKYLGRYTHRIAVSNHRLVALHGDCLTFSWRDRRDGNRRKLETLSAPQFLGRFLLHALPKGFVRIRHYGILANAVRRKVLPICRDLLDVPPPSPPEDESWKEVVERLTGQPPLQCPACQEGQLVEVDVIAAARPPPSP